jgi:tetratricopeptide (TPR) repeat protein
MQKLGKDPHFLYMYGYSLRKINQIEKSDSVLSLGTNYSSNPMFLNVMGNNSLTQGRYREAEERYKHAFYMVPNRLYPLYLLAKLYYTEGDTVRFLQMAEMVEEFIPKVESVNTESLRTEIRELKSTLIMTNNCDQ